MTAITVKLVLCFVYLFPCCGSTYTRCQHHKIEKRLWQIDHNIEWKRKQHCNFIVLIFTLFNLFSRARGFHKHGTLLRLEFLFCILSSRMSNQPYPWSSEHLWRVYVQVTWHRRQLQSTNQNSADSRRLLPNRILSVTFPFKIIYIYIYRCFLNKLEHGFHFLTFSCCL